MLFDTSIRPEVGSAEAWIWLIQSASYQECGPMKKAKSFSTRTCALARRPSGTFA